MLFLFSAVNYSIYMKHTTFFFDFSFYIISNPFNVFGYNINNFDIFSRQIRLLPIHKYVIYFYKKIVILLSKMYLFLNLYFNYFIFISTQL